MRPTNTLKDKSFTPGGLVQGCFGSDDNIVTAVYIHPSGQYFHLVAMYKPGTKKTLLWATIYNVEKVEGDVPDDLLRYAKKNPYWGREPGEKVTMRTNI